MKHKSMKATTLAAVLALSMSASALAAPHNSDGSAGTTVPGTRPGPNEITTNADTTISILTTKSTQPNISYTVPLYVTMAVVNQDDVVKVPTNYKITNTTPLDNGVQPSVGVTNMSFEKLNDTGFKTVDAAADLGADANNIYLTIGGAKMPKLSAKGIKPVPLTGSVFVNDNNKPRPLGEADLNKDLTITGKVVKTDRDDGATTAQFRLKYTVSLLNATGDALGAVYAGDDSTAAGLQEWINDAAPTN